MDILQLFIWLGIHTVLVALLAQRAEVKYDPERFLPNQIAALINNLGFQAELLDNAGRGQETMDVNVSWRIEGRTSKYFVSQ